MKKWLALGAAGVAAAVCVALLAGKDDIIRFQRMKSM